MERETSMKDWNPLVSIVIPVYNGANYLHEAIDSALAQTYKNCEILVVNDGSDDNGDTERIALSYGNKIRYFTKPNGGVATALNMGIENMLGDYFSWLSHDDLYTSDKIQQQIRILNKHDDKTTILACGFQIIDKDGKHLLDIDPLGAGQFTQQQLNTPLFALFQDAIHGCSLLIHKSHFDRVGIFDVAHKTTQDYDLFFRMMRNQSFYFHEGLSVISRSHDEQGSKKVIELHAKECDELWINIMSILSKEEMVQLSGSEVDFYRFRIRRFEVSVLPYEKAISYTEDRIVELINADDVSDSIEHFKEFSLLLHNISDEYEKQLQQALHNQSVQLNATMVEQMNVATQQMIELVRQNNRRPIRSFFVKALRFIYRVIRKIFSILGLKNVAKRNGIFRRLQEKGVVEKLSHKE
ncbi:MAG: glycosyltransferase [Oscillospiraceae bacterium]|nr:glycosyltransferase [Oscillospiraceae bacterium]